MGIIVGRDIYVQCDYCRNQSIPNHDQTKAVELADKAGWYRNPDNGKAMCPECRRGDVRKVDVAPTVATIMDMAHTMHRYGNEMERIAAKMMETGDISRASDAATAVANCIGNLRLDLLVTRPIRELIKRD